jgi:hypothetical protein
MALPLAALFVAGGFGLAALAGMASLRRKAAAQRRNAFIRAYEWPPGLLEKLRMKRRWFSSKNEARVAEGLRQFFLAHQMSGGKYVVMPSQVVDDLWHEFILYTRAYSDFCDKAFGGFLHHMPALALSPERRASNEGLRRVWFWCCRQEKIDAVRPDRLPLLFALDKELNIADGFHYTRDCSELRKAGVSSAYCGGDFASSDIDGSTAGLSDSGAAHGHGHDGASSGEAPGHGGHADSGGGHSCGGHSCGGSSCGGGGD